MDILYKHIFVFQILCGLHRYLLCLALYLHGIREYLNALKVL